MPKLQMSFLLRPWTLSRSISSISRTRTNMSLMCQSSRSMTKLPSMTIRQFSQTAITQHGFLRKPKPGQELHVTFITKEGEQINVEVAEGDNLLDIAQANNLDMEGACGGSCACSTCHVIVDPEYYDKIPEPDDDENDMLDLAFGLTETSRLGCQITMTKELDGLRVALPAMTRNMQVKDFN